MESWLIQKLHDREAKLLAENERLQALADERNNTLHRISESLESENKALRACVEFYGNPDNWTNTYGRTERNYFVMNRDCGDILFDPPAAVGGKLARQTLNDLKKDAE